MAIALGFAAEQARAARPSPRAAASGPLSLASRGRARRSGRRLRGRRPQPAAAALKVYHAAERDLAQLIHEARSPRRSPARGGPRLRRGSRSRLARARVGIRSARCPRADPRAQIESLVPLERWASPLARRCPRPERGVVHLDVKPANVLSATASAAILTDFGTARRAAPRGAGGVSATSRPSAWPVRAIRATTSTVSRARGRARRLTPIRRLAAGGPADV